MYPIPSNKQRLGQNHQTPYSPRQKPTYQSFPPIYEFSPNHQFTADGGNYADNSQPQFQPYEMKRRYTWSNRNINDEQIERYNYELNSFQLNQPSTSYESNYTESFHQVCSKNTFVCNKSKQIGDFGSKKPGNKCTFNQGTKKQKGGKQVKFVDYQAIQQKRDKHQKLCQQKIEKERKIGELSYLLSSFKSLTNKLKENKLKMENNRFDGLSERQQEIKTRSQQSSTIIDKEGEEIRQSLQAKQIEQVLTIIYNEDLKEAQRENNQVFHMQEQVKMLKYRNSILRQNLLELDQVAEEAKINQQLNDNVRRLQQNLMELNRRKQMIDQQIMEKQTNLMSELSLKQKQYRDLETRKNSIENCIKNLEKKRIQLNQKYQKELRLSLDTQEELKKTEQEINKEILIAQNLAKQVKNQQQKKMYEDLRQIEEENHIKKVNLTKERVENQKLELKLKKLLSDREHVQKRRAQIQRLNQIIQKKLERLEKINKLRDIKSSTEKYKSKDLLKKQQQKIIFDIEKLQSVQQEKQKKMSELKRIVKTTKLEIEKIELQQDLLEKQIQKPAGKAQKNENSITEQDKRRQKQKQITERQTAVKRPVEKKIYKKVTEQVRQSEFYLNKKLNIFSFTFTVLYLLGLVIAACYYNRIKLWFRLMIQKF